MGSLFSAFLEGERMKIFIYLGLLCSTLQLCRAGFSRGGFWVSGLGWNRRQICKTEDVDIQVMRCRLEWEEECSTENKKVGEKVVYQKECEDRDVKDCKWVQYVHPKYPSLGIHGGTSEDVECSKVTKKFCRDVPKTEDIMKDVETCVNTPKQVCEEKTLRTWKESCDRIKLGAADSGEELEDDAAEIVETREAKSDDSDLEDDDISSTQDEEAANVDDEDISLEEKNDTSPK